MRSRARVVRMFAFVAGCTTRTVARALVGAVFGQCGVVAGQPTHACRSSR